MNACKGNKKEYKCKLQNARTNKKMASVISNKSDIPRQPKENPGKLE